MGIDIITNELTNKRALQVAEMQVKGHLDAARIGASSKPYDMAEAYLNPNTTSEQRAAIEKFVNIKDKRDFSGVEKLNREKLWYETVQYQPEYKGLSAAKLEAARQQWVGGGGGGEVNKSNPLLTGK